MKKIINKENKRINKEKDAIKKEKAKIKEERKKLKQLKKKNFYNTKFGKLIKKIFKLDIDETYSISIKEQIFSMLYFELIGAILCLLILFALSGGKNFIMLYKDLNKLINVYDTIISDYYGNLDKDAMIDAAIESMLNGIGDSYTTYTNQETTNDFFENIEGTYEGIGCTVAMNEVNEIYIVSVFSNGPAEKAGLQKGDIILKIDGEDYSGKTSEEMAEYVKSNSNSKVKVTIRRENVEQELTIVREQVEVPSVASKIIEEQEKKIGYINVSVFSAVTYEQFKSELEKIEAQNIEGLIIDVRNDTGGYLTAVTEISSLFLKKGQVIYQLEGSKKTEKVKDETKTYRKYPIAVLINGGSASASEILAAAIKESYKYDGFVVGTNSYGKGTVQRTKKLSDGSMIKYTTQKWLTPDGNWINEVGVEPTDYVESSNLNGKDAQIEKAKSLIIEKIK